MKQKILILLFATLVGTGLTQASVVIDGIAYVINETKNVAAVIVSHEELQAVQRIPLVNGEATASQALETLLSIVAAL